MPMAVLSEECILRLQAATATACVEALRGAPHSELWTLVLAVVNPVVRAHAQKHMERITCIARLPDEVLLGIFEFLPFDGRVCAATVCQRWRSVSLDAVSVLWSDIPNLHNMQAYRFLFTRARDSPVTLAYDPEGLKDLEIFCRMLVDNLYRIKGLRLILPEPSHDDELLDAVEELCRVLEPHAPILESLVLFDPGRMYSSIFDRVPLLGSPLLRSIDLDGFGLSYLEACADSPALRALEVSTAETYETFLAEDWANLSRLPALESLTLHLPNVLAADFQESSPRLALSLQYLSLTAHPVILDALCAVENLSRFQRVDISFLQQSGDLRRLSSLLPFLQDTTISAAAHFSTQSFRLLASDSSGRTRVFSNIQLHNDWHTVLSNVRTLWLSVTNPFAKQANYEGSIAVLPALEEFALNLTNPISSVLLGPHRLSLPLLSCPRLRAVRFISEYPESPLPLEEVVDYLIRTLQSSASPPRRLDRLLFDGFSFPVSPHIDLAAALGAVAENVSIVQPGEVRPESYRAWDNPWRMLSDS